MLSGRGFRSTPTVVLRDSPWGWYGPSAARSVSVPLGSVSVASVCYIATASFVLRVADGFSRTIRDSASSRAYPGTPTRLRAQGAHRPHCAVSASCSEEFPQKLEHSQKKKSNDRSQTEFGCREGVCPLRDSSQRPTFNPPPVFTFDIPRVPEHGREYACTDGACCLTL